MNRGNEKRKRKKKKKILTSSVGIHSNDFKHRRGCPLVLEFPEGEPNGIVGRLRLGDENGLEALSRPDPVAVNTNGIMIKLGVGLD